MSNLVAITIGDINGIGIDILIKTWEFNKIKKFILFTDIEQLNTNIIIKKIKNNINIVNSDDKKLKFQNNKFNIYTYKTKTKEENTYKSLKYAYEFCIKKICIGIITLPLRKDLIRKRLNRKFIGHTEYFQKLDKKKYSNMILFHNKIIISPITTHIELKKISEKINNKQLIYNQIYNLNKTLKIDFNIKSPKLIVSGLNPHAGEKGYIGNEEIKIITPIVKKLKKIGINIDGPLSADSILIKNNLKKYDCFIFMYHDQALIPFKFISQFSGVNYTGNLNIIRVSPDHGTAYNLKKTKEFKNKSFINCYKLINQIYKNRSLNEKS